MSMDEVKPKGYRAMEKKMDMMEKKAKQEELRKIIRQEIRAAMKPQPKKKTTTRRKMG